MEPELELTEAVCAEGCSMKRQQLGSATEGKSVLKGTVRNYLAWTAFAVAGVVMAMQARSGERSQGDVGPDMNRVVVGVLQQGIEGVIEVEDDLAVREGPREEIARADRDAGAAGGRG